MRPNFIIDDFAQDKSFIIFLKKKYVKDFFLVFQFYCSDIDEFSPNRLFEAISLTLLN